MPVWVDTFFWCHFHQRQRRRLFGTSVAISSLDGTRLVVGAPMCDYNATEADEAAVKGTGGGILSGFSLETLVKSSVSACPFREMVRFGWSTALSADRERITVALCPTVVW